MKKPTRKPDKTKAKLKEATSLANNAIEWTKFLADELVAEQDENAEAESASLRVILRLIDGNAELAAENERIHELLHAYRMSEAGRALDKLSTWDRGILEWDNGDGTTTVRPWSLNGGVMTLETP